MSLILQRRLAIEPGVDLILILILILERIGDHATNIAEDAIF